MTPSPVRPLIRVARGRWRTRDLRFDIVLNVAQRWYIDASPSDAALRNILEHEERESNAFTFPTLHEAVDWLKDNVYSRHFPSTPSGRR